MGTFSIALAERGLIPLIGLRLGIRRLLGQRLREAAAGLQPAALVPELSKDRIAFEIDKANEQHYEVPPEFFEIVLGPHLKYSGSYWDEQTRELGEAELSMLDLSCERAQLENGQDILELGCGWGSFTLHMALRYPESQITAVSNSLAQRRFIEGRAPANVRVITADMNDFQADRSFDRIVSIEMFEHMRNYKELMRRICGWLHPSGRLFVHVFCHRKYTYLFETDGPDNWMGQHFFTGGLMPSLDLFEHFDSHVELKQRWEVPGVHYSRTARAWRENLEVRKSEVLEVFKGTYGPHARRWYHRWRIFFLACEELFGYRSGTEWMVGHYLFSPKPQA